MPNKFPANSERASRFNPVTWFSAKFGSIGIERKAKDTEQSATKAQELEDEHIDHKELCCCCQTYLSCGNDGTSDVFMWWCDDKKCDNKFCAKCFIKRFGQAAYYRMIDKEAVLCPSCYKKRHLPAQ